jgi:hypothetical protein
LRAKVEAIARPIPEPAPVTIAVLPSSRNTPRTLEQPRAG